MAITSELIGKLGGGSIDWKMKSIEGTWNGNNSTHFIYRVEVPAGEQKLVVMAGNMHASSGSSSHDPIITFGPYTITFRTNEGDNEVSMGGVFSESADIEMQTRGSSYQSPITFTGGIYMTDYDAGNIVEID